MKTKFKFIRRALLLLTCLASFSFAGAIKPSQAIINLVKSDIQQAQYQLPVQSDYCLEITKIWYIPESYTVAYKYVYCMNIEKPSNNAIYEMKQSVVHMLKAQPNSKDMTYLTNGITFHYNYYNPDGTFLYAVKITPADVK